MAQDNEDFIANLSIAYIVAGCLAILANGILLLLLTTALPSVRRNSNLLLSTYLSLSCLLTGASGVFYLPVLSQQASFYASLVIECYGFLLFMLVLATVTYFRLRCVISSITPNPATISKVYIVGILFTTLFVSVYGSLAVPIFEKNQRYGIVDRPKSGWIVTAQYYFLQLLYFLIFISTLAVLLFLHFWVNAKLRKPAFHRGAESAGPQQASNMSAGGNLHSQVRSRFNRNAVVLEVSTAVICGPFFALKIAEICGADVTRMVLVSRCLAFSQCLVQPILLLTQDKMLRNFVTRRIERMSQGSAAPLAPHV